MLASIYPSKFSIVFYINIDKIIINYDFYSYLFKK